MHEVGLLVAKKIDEHLATAFSYHYWSKQCATHWIIQMVSLVQNVIFQLGNNHTHLAFHLWEGDLDCCDCDVAWMVVPEGDEDDEDGDDNHGGHDDERVVSLWRLLNLLLDDVGALLGHSDVSERLDYNYRVHLGGAALKF